MTVRGVMTNKIDVRERYMSWIGADTVCAVDGIAALESISSLSPSGPQDETSISIAIELQVLTHALRSCLNKQVPGRHGRLV